MDSPGKYHFSRSSVYLVYPMRVYYPTCILIIFSYNYS